MVECMRQRQLKTSDDKQDRTEACDVGMGRKDLRYGTAPFHPLSSRPQIASFIGYIFNYLKKIEKVNLEQREAAEAMMEAMEAAEAAAAEGEAAEGEAAAGEPAEEAAERFYSIMPYKGPTLPDHIKARLANRRVANSPVANSRVANSRVANRLVANRRFADQPGAHPARRRPVLRPAKPIRKSRPYPSRIYRRRDLIKRSAEQPKSNTTGEVETGRPAAATTSERGEGVMAVLAHTGYEVLGLLKKLLLKESQTVDREIKDLMEETADSLTEELIIQLDSDGCLQKLLCYLQDRTSGSLSPEEEALLAVFPTRWPADECTADHFPRCVLTGEQMEALLPPAATGSSEATP